MYTFKLYLSGETPDSVAGIKNVKAALEGKLKEKYSLEVINLLDHPQLAEKEGIFVTPTLAKVSPPPIKKIIGDLNSIKNALAALDLVML